MLSELYIQSINLSKQVDIATLLEYKNNKNIQLEDELKHNAERLNYFIKYDLAKLYEIACGLELSEKYGYQIYYWPLINPDNKDKVGLSIQDTGIDLADSEVFKYAGQVKHYKTGSSVSAEDLNRTFLSVYHSRDCCRNYDQFKQVDIITPNTINISKHGKLCFNNKYQHIIIDNDILLKWIDKCQQQCNVSNTIKIKIHNSPKQNTPVIENIKDVRDEPVIDLPITNFNWRKCQVQAFNIFNNNIDKSIRLRLMCGSGKTLFGLACIHQLMLKYPDYKICCLVPRIVLLDQWYDKMQEYNKLFNSNLICNRYGGGYNEEYNTNFYLCVYNSFSKISDYKWNYLIIDEAHHFDKNEDENDEDEGNFNITYTKIIYDKIKVVTTIHLSATLSGDCDYNYNLRQAIDDGTLVDYQIFTPIFNSKSFNSSFDAMIEYIKIRPHFSKILAYCNTKQQAKQFSEQLNINGISSTYLTCDENRETRHNIFENFRTHQIRVLVSIKILSEGIDLPYANTCLFVDNRSSKNNIIQCVGRTLRTYKDKRLAYIILPGFCYDGENEYIPMLNTILNLCSEDSILYNKIKNREYTNRIKLDMIETSNNSDISYLYDKIYDWGGNMLNYTGIRPEWLENLWEHVRFYKENNRLMKNKEIPTNYNSNGGWLANQRISSKGQGHRKPLTAQQIQLLNEHLPGWQGVSKDEIWMNNFNEHVRFYQNIGRLMKKTEKPADYNSNGGWLATQRTNSKGQGKYKPLTVEQIQLLNENLPGWQGQTISKYDIWMNNFNEHVRFYQNNGRLMKQTENPTDYNSNGTWLFNQRAVNKSHIKRLKSLTLQQIQLLNEYLPGWEGISNKDMWINNLDEHVRFYQNNARLMKAGENPTDYNSNGDWLITQRRASKGKGKYKPLTAQQLQLLNVKLPGWHKNDPVILQYIEQTLAISKNNTLTQEQVQETSLIPTNKAPIKIKIKAK